ncbi:MAG: hypothetical protein EOM76_13025, partial [Sphingobacteriia bacterium]|nr:hypothetical protein [Sphingobacteriia bacterium]
TISYGRTYMADKDMVSAVVLAGYADGFPRRASNQAVLTVNGQRIRQVGRVCMDMMMTDATGLNVKRGDEVTLFGNGGMSCEELSEIVGTINYELTCLVTPRTKRIYKGEQRERQYSFSVKFSLFFRVSFVVRLGRHSKK